ncbi:hypothetical protein BDZ89DRAFT_1073719 [Hymenopellis radicata]|nr:hypothetical protein BDZ89DRAFT_1073719 [Hymenopellis radicata]
MATLSTSITEVRFFRENWILTVANAIWSVLTIWDWKSGIKRSEWSPQGSVFNGPLTLNANPDAVACAAILTSQLNGPQHIVLLALDDAGRLTSILEIPTTLRPIALHGTRLALCDDARTTTIHDYESGTTVCLDSPLVHGVDHCIDVVFAPFHLLIVRARSIALFGYPSGDLIATHSFGWVDGASVSYNQHTNVISLLIRHQSDNPWTADVSTLQLHNIFPTKDGSGFVFPPVAAAGISSPRGALRCPDVVLGRYGTAVWISPQERTMVVDEASDLLSKETLVAAAFPGPLNVDSRVTAVKMYTNSLNNWTALDYDEEHGRVALGSSFGKVTVLQL